eukprot:372504-Hanusia_phi.AAC.3
MGGLENGGGGDGRSGWKRGGRKQSLNKLVLHEIGVIKYLGDKLASDPGEQDQGKSSVEDTVFIDPAWMIEVFKGEMREDWRHLQEAFKGDSTRSKKLKKLLHHRRGLVPVHVAPGREKLACEQVQVTSKGVRKEPCRCRLCCGAAISLNSLARDKRLMQL